MCDFCDSSNFLNSGESGISDVFVILVNLRIFGNVVILVNLVILLKPMILQLVNVAYLVKVVIESP